MMNTVIKKKKNILIGIAIIMALMITGKHVAEHVMNSDVFFTHIVEKRADEKKKSHEEFLSKDEIKVVLVGTAGPMSPDLAQNSTAVFVNGQFLLFDAGDYAQKRMEQFEMPSEDIDAVFLTHFHNDHIADLGEVMQRSWILGRQKDFLVYGPTGTERIVEGFNMIYTKDTGHRTDHHGEEYMPPEFQSAKAIEFDSDIEEQVIYEKDGVVVTAFPVYHPPIDPTFAYKIEYLDKKVVISGDTIVTDKLAFHSQDADLLVMDTMNYDLVTTMENTYRDMGNERLATIMYDIREYHPDVKDSAKMARDSKVKRLALTHYAPAAPYKIQMEGTYIKPIKKIYKGEVYAGDDGLTVSIPMD